VLAVFPSPVDDSVLISKIFVLPLSGHLSPMTYSSRPSPARGAYGTSTLLAPLSWRIHCG
jgi:hypothetical protein